MKKRIGLAVQQDVELSVWREILECKTWDDLAAALGLSPRMLRRYRAGEHKIPRPLYLAFQGALCQRLHTGRRHLSGTTRPILANRKVRPLRREDSGRPVCAAVAAAAPARSYPGDAEMARTRAEVLAAGPDDRWTH